MLALTLVLASTVLFVYACKKETQQKEFIAKPFSSEQASSRDAFAITTIGWLDTFQTNLALAVGNNSLTQTYTFEKMASGVEALINIATVSGQARLAHQSQVSDFQITVSSSTQALKDLYIESYDAYRDHWLSMDTTETYPVVIEVSILSLTGNTLNVRVTTVMGVCNSCLNEHYTNSEACDEAFETGEAYFVGGGDQELSLVGNYILPMCNNSCGSTPACEMPSTTAYEQIEDRINFNYLANNPPCGPGTVLQGYINVTGPIFAQGPQYDFLEEDCGIVDQEIGTCMDDDALNCAYCSFYEQIGIDPFEIPAGKQFISLNLGVDYCFCGETLCEYLAHPIAEYYYGCPVCRTSIVYPGWHDPVYVSLAYLTI